MTQPCRNCGGPKPKGRGVKLCAACCDTLYYRDGKTRRGVHRPRVESCKRCGGPKVPAGEHAKRGQRFCAPCKEITQAEYKERKRVAAQVRWLTKLKPQRQAEVRPVTYLSRKDGQSVSPAPPKVRAKPKPKPKPVPKPRVKKAPVVKTQAPSEVRSAWRSSHPNSQIKRLYPTVEKLNQAYRDGKLRGYEHAARRLP